MGFLDNDYGGKLIVEYVNDSPDTFHLPELGDNAYEEIDINRSNVRRITLDVERSAAIAFIRFRPGSTPPVIPETDIIEIPFYTSFIEDADVCFDPIAWCDIEVFTILMASLESSNDLTPDQFDVFLNGLQALFCDAAAEAVANAFGVIYGQGVFRLDRLGGNVEEINLDVNMNTATMALADVDASAVAYADVSDWSCTLVSLCHLRSHSLTHSLPSIHHAVVCLCVCKGSGLLEVQVQQPQVPSLRSRQRTSSVASHRRSQILRKRRGRCFCQHVHKRGSHG
jgi:hypothetical protein